VNFSCCPQWATVHAWGSFPVAGGIRPFPAETVIGLFARWMSRTIMFRTLHVLVAFGAGLFVGFQNRQVAYHESNSTAPIFLPRNSQGLPDAHVTVKYPNHSVIVPRISSYTNMSQRGCLICNTLNTSARVFLPARADGLGAHFAQFVSQAGMAARAGANFGGFKGLGPVKGSQHGISVADFMADLFEQKLYFDLNDFELFQSYTANNWDEVKTLIPKSAKTGRPIFCMPGCDVPNANTAGFHYLKSPIVDLLHNQGARFKIRHSHRLQFISPPQFPTVAMHIRRVRQGDREVGGSEQQAKGIEAMAPLSYYRMVVSEILAVYAEADIHVFSSGDSFTLSSSRNLTYHFDDGKRNPDVELYKLLVHLMSSDVVVMAKSNLSYLCVLFGGNQCVISGLNWWEVDRQGGKPLNWMELDPRSPHSAAGHLRVHISSCLRRLNPLKYCPVSTFSC
jgi:hypothetical protein